jgi:hypothetical protein
MIDQILEERGGNYGDFHTQANLSQTLKAIVNQHYSSVHSDKPMPQFMLEAIHMICHKLARIANGNPYYVDSWQDIAGYSQLVVDILEKAQTQAAKNIKEENITELKGVE